MKKFSMKKFIVATFLSILLLGSSAFAQDLYLGVGGAPTTNTDDDTLGLSAQLGVGLIANFSVRAAVEASADLANFRLASGDLLYSLGLPITQSTLYLGAGADVFFVEQPDSIDDVRNQPLGLHVVGGGELRLGRFGVFGEVQPGLLLENRDTYVRARAGVNLHF